MYEVRHRLWSQRGQQEASTLRTRQRTVSDDAAVVLQSVSIDDQHQEQLEEREHEKSDREHWADSQSDGKELQRTFLVFASFSGDVSNYTTTTTSV